MRTGDAVERLRRLGAVQAELNQRSGFPRQVGLRPHPLGLHGFGRPDHDDGLRARQPFLDRFSEGRVHGQVVRAPDTVIERAQGLADLVGRRFRGLGVGDENARIGHDGLSCEVDQIVDRQGLAARQAQPHGVQQRQPARVARHSRPKGGFLQAQNGIEVGEFVAEKVPDPFEGTPSDFSASTW